MKKEIIDDLKKRAECMINNFEEKQLNIQNEKEIKKLKMVQDALEDEDIFFKIPFNVALLILKYLGVENKDILNTYEKLVDPKEYKMRDKITLKGNGY